MAGLYRRKEKRMEQISFGIRADGNAKIGMGHLMRTMSIAIALKEQQVNVFYITNDLESKRFVEERGFSCYLLSNVYGNMESEAEETLAFIKDKKIRLLLVDSYNATEAYLSAIRSQVKVCYVDDLGRMNLPVFALINYNIYGNKMGYEQSYPSDVALLLGSSYAPVKPQFLKTSYEVRKNVKNIMITMGGSDSLNIAGKLAQELLNVLDKDVTLTLVCGRFNPHLQTLHLLKEKDSRINVLTDVTNMWDVMAESDLCISAAGSTMYELCVMGVPTVCCYYVENQRRIAEGFAEQIGLCNAGDFSKEADNVLCRIKEEVQILNKDYETRKELSQKMKAICDGNGARRIAEALLALG